MDNVSREDLDHHLPTSQKESAYKSSRRWPLEGGDDKLRGTQT